VAHAGRYNEDWQGVLGRVVEDTRGYTSAWTIMVGLFRPSTGGYEEDSFMGEELAPAIPTEEEVARWLAHILEDS
jgi:hypothetical protein